MVPLLDDTTAGPARGTARPAAGRAEYDARRAAAAAAPARAVAAGHRSSGGAAADAAARTPSPTNTLTEWSAAAPPPGDGAGSTEPPIRRRARDLYFAACDRVAARTDRSFALLMLAQWALVVGAAFVAPLLLPAGRAPAGLVAGAVPAVPLTLGGMPMDFWIALIGGGAITALPVAYGLLRPGRPFTRFVIAVAQMLMSGLLGQVTGERLGTPFHAFGSLVFLAGYLDWRVLLAASLVMVADHGLRGAIFPLTFFGTGEPQPFQWLESFVWVAFTDTFLFLGVRQRLKEMWRVAERQARLEEQNATLEDRARALATSEERFRQLAESLREVLWIVDAEKGELLYVSPAFEDVWGRSRESLYRDPQSLLDTFLDDDRERLRAAMARQAAGLPMSAELRIVRPDGGVRWVHTRSFSMPPEDGRQRILGVTEDITERKAEETMRAADQQRDRRIAASLQASLLMPPPPGSLSGVSVETLHRPARRDEAHVGGDFFDIFPLERDSRLVDVAAPNRKRTGGLVALVLGDISGKGLSAATRTAEVKYALRAYLRDRPSGSDALRRLNRYVLETQALEERRFGGFIALTIVVLDTQTGEAEVAQAGAEPALLLRAPSGGRPLQVEVVGGPDTGGLPLGVDGGAEYDPVSVRVGPGDVLLLTTDGLGEARSAASAGASPMQQEMLGTEGIARLMEEAARRAGTGTSLRDLGAHLIAGAQEFTGAGGFQDDVCLLLASPQGEGR